ncbi:MAG TPA: transposase [Streptosporangiaceae bacterium]
MTLGVTPRQADLFRGTAALCEGRVAPGSICGILHRECFGLFPDGMLADLFTGVGRRSVPPVIVAVVMVLQRIEGLPDRAAADRLALGARWKYAAGGLDFDYPGFAHTVLAGMRARLARSGRPGRSSMSRWRPAGRPAWRAGGGCWMTRRHRARHSSEPARRYEARRPAL